MQQFTAFSYIILQPAVLAFHYFSLSLAFILLKLSGFAISQCLSSYFTPYTLLFMYFRTNNYLNFLMLLFTSRVSDRPLFLGHGNKHNTTR